MSDEKHPSKQEKMLPIPPLDFDVKFLREEGRPNVTLARCLNFTWSIGMTADAQMHSRSGRGFAAMGTTKGWC